MLPRVLGACCLIGLQLTLTTARAGASFCDDDEAGGFRTVFRDEFDGAKLDESKWNVEVAAAPGGGRLHSVAAERPRQRARVGADCSGQGCIQLGSCRDAACVRSESYVDAGALTLRSSRTGTSNFTTGAVNTWGKAGWRASEGAFRVCISARLPGVGSDGSSQGLWPAHWLMPHDNTCDPDEGEMDIMEMVDGNGLYEATYHWETTFPKANCSYPTGHGHAFAERPLPTWNTSYHEYAVERGMDYVAFVLDGEVQLNVTKAHRDPKVGPPIFWDAEWYLILNTAVGGGWPGLPSSATVFPAYHRIDYVRVSQHRAAVPTA